MIIDGHQHLLHDPETQQLLAAEAGLDKTVLFSTVVHPECANTREEFINEMGILNKILSGQINPVEARIKSITELVERIRMNPRGYLGFGSCPSGLNIDQTGEWIEQWIIKNNLRGIGEIALGPGQVSAIENIFQYLHEQQHLLPLWIHTFNPLGIADIQQIIDLAIKYSRVHVILGHSGGSHWLETLERVKSQLNIYMDLSASFSVLPIKFISEAIPERCVFSSDAPYGNPYLGRQQIEYIIKDVHIRNNVLGLNTARLLNI
jgi:uncharacterized protein